MKKLFTIPAAFFFVLSFSQTIYPQNSKNAVIKQIERYIKKINSAIKNKKEPDLIFADVSQNNKPRWRKFSSSKALEKFHKEKTETYSIAYNWKRDNKIIVSNFTLFSESGDWAKYIYHYFRADGTIAKVESVLNTFYGHFSFIESIYFDTKGKILKKTSKYLDLETEKPKTPSKDDILDNGDNIKTFYYKKTSKLPFANLLRSARK